MMLEVVKLALLNAELVCRLLAVLFVLLDLLRKKMLWQLLAASNVSSAIRLVLLVLILLITVQAVFKDLISLDGNALKSSDLLLV